MTKSTNGFKYVAKLLGALAILAIAPATAFAANSDSSESGACNYINADGYSIRVQNRTDVNVDGKVVSCRSGSIVVTLPPTRASDLLPALSQAGLRAAAPRTPGRPVFARVPLVIAAP